MLHVVDSLGPGGMENGIVNLARGLAPEIQSDVACLVHSGPFAARLPATSRVFVLGKANGFSPIAAWRLFHSVRRTGARVLHTHNIGPLIYGALATGFGRFCSMIHGEHSRLTTEEKLPRRLRQRRRYFRACRAIHTVSSGIRDELVALGCEPGPMRVIPNGVNTDVFSPGDRHFARRALGLPESGRMLGIVGRFGAEKGHGVLIEAFEMIAGRSPDLHLAIIGGGGPAEAEVRGRAALSPVHARIHFTGFLQDPADGYRSLDLLAIPSTNEGMANAALEAMACGLPILANTGCGHEEFMQPGNDGMIADLRDATALASAIERLLADPNRLRALGEQARRTAVEHFSLEKMVTAYRALYTSTLANSAR